MQNQLLWTQDDGLAWCQLDDLRFEIHPYADAQDRTWFQLIISTDGRLVDNQAVGRSAIEMAVYAEGMAATDDLSHAAGRKAVETWAWQGNLWQAPETEIVEFEEEDSDQALDLAPEQG